MNAVYASGFPLIEIATGLVGIVFIASLVRTKNFFRSAKRAAFTGFGLVLLAGMVLPGVHVECEGPEFPVAFAFSNATASPSIVTVSFNDDDALIDDKCDVNCELDDVWSEDPSLDDEADSARIEIRLDEDGDKAPRKLQLSDDRPDWVFDDWKTDTSKHRITVQVGPCDTWREADWLTNEELVKEVGEYAMWYLTGKGSATALELSADEIQVPVSRIRRYIIDSHDCLFESGVESAEPIDPLPMRYVLLELDDGFRRRYVEPVAQNAVSVKRAKNVGVLWAGLLSLVGMSYGTMRLRPSKNTVRVVAAALGVAIIAMLAVATMVVS